MGRVPMIRVLERLARQPTAPLHEHAVLAEAVRIAKEFDAQVRFDEFGNLIVRPRGARKGPAVWLVAHTDHPGFEVVGRREAVFLGGVAPTYLRRGTPLRFYRDGAVIPATIGGKERRGLRWRVRLHGDQAGVLRKGDFGVWELPDFQLRSGHVRARQLDDLAGSAVSLAAVARACRDRRLNLVALLTRAEEIGFVGSLGAATQGLIPRAAWIINVEASKAIPGVEIGGGPVIRVGDRQRTFDAGAENLLHVARAKLGAERPVQRWLMSGGTCEATAWGLFGYRATGVAIPLGNYHNQGPRERVAPETVSAEDLATAVDLVELAAKHAGSAPRRDTEIRARILRYLRRYGERLRASRPKSL